MDDHDAQPLAPLRIYILDDNDGIRRVLRSVLAGFGCTQVHDFAAIEPALAALPELRPDLIIADYELGGTTGLQFVAALRAHEIEELRTTPVIMLTSHTTPQEVRSFVNGGVDEAMAKPIRPAVLYDRIVALVNEPFVYVQVGSYFGPDRRRDFTCYDMPDRRRDANDAEHTPEPSDAKLSDGDKSNPEENSEAN